jgi:hypothetical protein
MVVPYLCSRFHIFDRPILEEYVSQVEEGSQLLQSYLCVAWDGLPPVTKKMHLFKKNLAVTGALGVHASLMDFHHDTSLKFILEDDSISLASRTCICSCSNKGARLWLVARPSICSFRISHFTFTSTLRFCFSLIQLSTFSFLTCEYGHGLDTFGMHLVHCAFRGQHITTHDTIQNVMYALNQENEHVVWREWWYARTSWVSL